MLVEVGFPLPLFAKADSRRSGDAEEVDPIKPGALTLSHFYELMNWKVLEECNAMERNLHRLLNLLIGFCLMLGQ